MKKLSRPFQSLIHARRTYRELRLLKHLKHENVSRRSQGGGRADTPGMAPWCPGGPGQAGAGREWAEPQGPPEDPRGPDLLGAAQRLNPGPASAPRLGHRASGCLHTSHIHRGLQRSVSGWTGAVVAGGAHPGMGGELCPDP